MNKEKNPLRMVQIEPHIWKRLDIFFDEVDIPFFINDAIDNALEDFIVTISRVSEAKVEAYRASLEEE